MNTLAYTTETGSTNAAYAAGWDYFDALVLWAVSERPTLVGIVNILPPGLSLHLIGRALDLAVADGLLLRVLGDTVGYQLTPAGRAALAERTAERRAA